MVEDWLWVGVVVGLGMVVKGVGGGGVASWPSSPAIIGNAGAQGIVIINEYF